MIGVAEMGLSRPFQDSVLWRSPRKSAFSATQGLDGACQECRQKYRDPRSQKQRKTKGIRALCQGPCIEGINNKIEIIKRMGCGLRDDDFFLTIRHAFPRNR